MAAVGEVRSARTRAARRPATIALAVALAVAVIAVRGLDAGGLIGAAFAVLLVVLAAIDLDQRIIPNRIVLPGAAAVLAAQIATAPDRWAEWAGAAIGAAAFLGLPLVFVRGGVGMGDLKLALLLGAGLGAAVADALLYAAIGGALAGFAVLSRNGAAGLQVGMPFGPFLAAGGVIALFTGAHVL